MKKMGRLGITAAASVLLAAALAPPPETTARGERSARNSEAPHLPEPYGPQSNRKARRKAQREARKAMRRRR